MPRCLVLRCILGACAPRSHVLRLEIAYATEARDSVRTQAVAQVGHTADVRAVAVLPGCVLIATIDPVNEHTMCLRGETDREIRLPGRPDTVRAQACEGDGDCTHAIVDQWDVSGEELLARLDR